MCDRQHYYCILPSSATRKILVRVVGNSGSATWITPISRAQAVLQAYFRPGVWFPIIRSFHSRRERWIMPSGSNRSNMEEILRGLMTVSQNDKSRSMWTIKKADPTFVQVHVFTRFEWLDVIEFRINGSSVEVRSFSSGFLPLWIPFAFVFNLFLFWVPFWDMGRNRRRIARVLDAIDIGIQRV